MKILHKNGYVSDTFLLAVDQCSDVNTCFEGVKPACSEGIPQLCLVLAYNCEGVPANFHGFFICKRGSKGL